MENGNIITNFTRYFTIYEATEPPPIQTEGYAKVRLNYEEFMIPSKSNKPIQESTGELTEESLEVLTPFEFKIDSPFKFETSIQSSPISIQRLSSIATDIVNTARQFVGTKYSWGGTTPSTGFDCSGLIYYAYKLHGINLPRTSKEMSSIGLEVLSLDQALVGDIIYTPGHVKMVSKIENGLIYTVEAKGRKHGIVETPLSSTSNITTIRRVLGNNTNNSSRSNNYIVLYFIQKGLTQNLARGIYGNLMLESRGNLRAVSSDGNNSYGLAQWTGSRKKTLFNKYGANPTMQLQLDFLWWELNNTHKSALNKLKSTTTISDATRVFMNEFERPNKRYANFNRRLLYANSVI